jgi:1-acyl-sn-glycerol-3-phosphate acyltransferase
LKSLITTYRWVVAFIIMTVTGLISLLLVALSFGSLRNFCARYILNYSSRFILRIMGFRSIYPPLNVFPKQKVLYTFNHNSYADVFLLTGIGLRNLRYVLSEKTLVYVPLVISALAAGTLYIPQKKHSRRRLNFFIRTTKFLKRNNFSIAASAEGVHEHHHGIAPFNRGIFHMAIEANLPIVPIYIHIPEESNMFKTEYATKGTFIVEILDQIETSGWSYENLDEHKDQVRKVFVERFNELNPKHSIE